MTSDGRRLRDAAQTRVSHVQRVWRALLDRREQLSARIVDVLFLCASKGIRGRDVWFTPSPWRDELREAQEEVDEIDRVLAKLHVPRAVLELVRRVRGRQIIEAHRRLVELLPRISKNPSVLDRAIKNKSMHWLSSAGKDEWLHPTFIRKVLLDQSERGPLAVLRTRGPVDAAAAALAQLNVASRSTVYRYVKKYKR